MDYECDTAGNYWTGDSWSECNGVVWDCPFNPPLGDVYN